MRAHQEDTEASRPRGPRVTPSAPGGPQRPPGARSRRPHLHQPGWRRRPAQAWRDGAPRGACDAVVVWSPERLARDAAQPWGLSEALTTLPRPRIGLPHPCSDPSPGTRLTQRPGLSAADVPAQRRERTRRGRRANARRGDNWPWASRGDESREQARAPCAYAATDEAWAAGHGTRRTRAAAAGDPSGPALGCRTPGYCPRPDQARRGDGRAGESSDGLPGEGAPQVVDHPGSTPEGTPGHVDRLRRAHLHRPARAVPLGPGVHTGALRVEARGHQGAQAVRRPPPAGGEVWRMAADERPPRVGPGHDDRPGWPGRRACRRSSRLASVSWSGLRGPRR